MKPYPIVWFLENSRGRKFRRKEKTEKKKKKQRYKVNRSLLHDFSNLFYLFFLFHIKIKWFTNIQVSSRIRENYILIDFFSLLHFRNQTQHWRLGVGCNLVEFIRRALTCLWAP